jgi:hypothetical protein
MGEPEAGQKRGAAFAAVADAFALPGAIGCRLWFETETWLNPQRLCHMQATAHITTRNRIRRFGLLAKGPLNDPPLVVKIKILRGFGRLEASPDVAARCIHERGTKPRGKRVLQDQLDSVKTMDLT